MVTLERAGRWIAKLKNRVPKKWIALVLAGLLLLLVSQVVRAVLDLSNLRLDVPGY